MKKGVSSKSKFFILLLGYVVITLIWYLGLYNFYEIKIDAVKEKKQELTLNYNQLPEIISKTKEVVVAADSLKNELMKLKTKSSTIKDLNQVKQDFTRFCSNYRLEVVEFTPLTQLYYQKLETGESAEYLTLPINIILNGNYDNFTRFMLNLDRFSKSITIGYMKVSPNEKRENMVDLVFLGKLLVTSEQQ